MMWGCGGIVFFDFNIANWSEVARLAVLMLGVSLGFLLFIIKDLEES